MLYEKPWRYPFNQPVNAKREQLFSEKPIQGLAEKAGDGVEFFVPDSHVARRKIAFHCQCPIDDAEASSPPSFLRRLLGSRPDAFFRFGHAT
jgi:hypothetical protein